jgi:hypothetical protein
MHLSSEDLEAHFNYVSEILKPGGQYIFATLNPDYELMKAGRTLADGERYDFMHGKTGEYGTFYHYYKTREHYESTIRQYFEIEEVVSCTPATNRFKESHARYYDKDVPIALVYSLKASK